jgi:hypothetical protein
MYSDHANCDIKVEIKEARKVLLKIFNIKTQDPNSGSRIHICIQTDGPIEQFKNAPLSPPCPQLQVCLLSYKSHIENLIRNLRIVAFSETPTLVLPTVN